MGTKQHRLQENMENLARRRQKEYENREAWVNTTQYFKHWDKQNTRYDNWTSEHYYQKSLDRYYADKKHHEKVESLFVRREKLKKLLTEEETEYAMELRESPRNRRVIRKEVPINVLKEINVGLKLAEEDRRRHEAELKLYHQWRNENPIIRDFETKQNCQGLKLAWLDQQIEKRMAQEKHDVETKKMLEDRERLLKQEEEIERAEMAQEIAKEKILREQIEEHMEALKLNESKKQDLMKELGLAARKKNEIEEIIANRDKDLERRKCKEVALFNINQAKLKLRQKAVETEEQLRKEKLIIEDIEALKITDALQNEEQKRKTKEAMQSYLNYVKEQQKLEAQRQQYVSFIFDSEAKVMWQKQEKIWREEQATRDKLLNNVLCSVKKQVEEKIEKNEFERRMIEKEKEQVLQSVNDFQIQIGENKKILEKKRNERKYELEQQINDRRLAELEKELEDQRRKKEELENIRKEEEKLKNELMQMQRSKYHPARYQRNRHFW